MQIMDFLIVLNVVFWGWALFSSLRRCIKTNPRLWLRIPAVFISGYICVVYLLVLVHALSETDIPVLMRWFQLVIAAYIVVEAKNG